MPLTREQAGKAGKKAVEVAGYSTPANLAVKGGKAAARWALDKYRAYSKAKAAKEAEERKKKAEKGADTYQPPAATQEKKAPKKKKSQLDRIRENQRRKRESLNY
jgi:hypothetical protein